MVAWKSKTTRWVLIAICGVTVIVFSLMHVFRVNATRLPPSEKQWPVSVITLPEPGSHTPHLFLYGRVDHSDLTQLSAGVSSTVSRVLVKEGDQIKSGQLLIELSSREYQLALRLHESDLAHLQSELESEVAHLKRLENNRDHQKQLLDLAQASLDRYNSLNQKNYVSAEELSAKQREFNLRSMAYHNSLEDVRLSQHEQDRLKLRAEKLMVQIQKDQINVDHCYIQSPVLGQVTKIAVAKGERAISGNFVIEIMPSEKKEVHALIPLAYAPIIQNNLDLNLPITAQWPLNGSTIVLDLIRLTPYVKEAQAGQEGIFVAPLDDASLVMGVHAPVTVDLPAVDSSYVIPESALYHDSQVYVVDKNRLHAVHVNVLGSIYNDRKRNYVIKSDDLTTGQHILTVQLPQAVNGLLVSITPQGS